MKKTSRGCAAVKISRYNASANAMLALAAKCVPSSHICPINWLMCVFHGLGSVHRMVTKLGDAFLNQDCTVLGSNDGPECGVFLRTGIPAVP